MDDAVWSPTTFTKNRDRLLDGEIAAAFFDAIVIHADRERLLSNDHFTVMHVARRLASHKSFRPLDEEPPPAGGGESAVISIAAPDERDPRSTTDPDARLYKKAQGREARLGYLATC